MTFSDKIAAISLIVAAASLVVSVTAAGISWYAIIRSNKTTSAAILVTLQESFRQAWERFFADDSARSQQTCVSDMLNLFETACALYFEKSLTGKSRYLMHEYMKSLLKEFADHSIVDAEIVTLLQDKSTYAHVKRFINDKAATVSVVVPPKWYQTQG